MPVDAPPNDRIAALVEEAYGLYTELAAPIGLRAEVTLADFAHIYRGEGANAPETPLATIYPRAKQLALFAVTLGEPISARIAELFEARDFALGSLLDSVASAAADQSAAVAEAGYAAELLAQGACGPGDRTLRYSPGYCGWHVSGQRALFAHLKPEAIGISLRESCLMQPLKSVSGVIVCGPAAIHEFADDYYFCADCTTRGCRERMQTP
jgi:hypothetical protein